MLAVRDAGARAARPASTSTWRGARATGGSCAGSRARGRSSGEARDTEAALGDFVRLHAARAASKGERHPQVDARLARMLAGWRAAPSFELRMLELGARRPPARRAGSGSTAGPVAWYYNLGIDPDALPLAPGIALQLEAIRCAIERGRQRMDLGPGAHPYKLELGGVLDGRVDARAVSPAGRGRVVDGAERLARRARRSAGRMLRR